MSDKINKILIASGGTGGHILPATSLNFFLDNNGFETILTTDKRGLKYINKKQKNIFIIDSSPLSKGKIIFSFVKIIFATFKSFFFLIKSKPKLIIGMGGYASVPLCFSAIFLRIPFIIYENNSIMGRANKFLSPFAKKIFVSYKNIDGIKKKYERKVKVIGNILGEKILNFNPTEKIFNNNCMYILILGGSQAAQIFADLIPPVLIRCKKNKINLKVYQQCHPDQTDALKSIYEKNQINYELFNFTFDIIKYYQQADLAISRSGSSALAELLNCNIPIIAVPLKTLADNHQYKNARFFEKEGYCILMEEQSINTELFNLLHSIYKDKSIINAIRQKQSKHKDKNVFNIIIKEINCIYEN